jgi:hypothetical protein
VSPILLDDFSNEFLGVNGLGLKVRALPDVHCILLDLFLGLLPHTQKEHHVLLLEVVLIEHSVGFGKIWISKQAGLKELFLTDLIFVILHLCDNRSLLFLRRGLLKVDKPVVPLRNNFVWLGRCLVKIEHFPELRVLIKLVDE